MIKNYINGELREPVSEKYFDNFDPATGEAYSIVPDSDERDVELAVTAAEAAFPSWANTPAEERT
ncbi:MAG TPA: aldehyde dehydrogenase family protein, partial [Ignavibacteria bacterium]|nr:aldehyde dehydrogenase family protein [Ignavibacteria bacterium]